jgi:hypothetical protein
VVELEELIASDHAELERAVYALSAWAPTAEQRATLDAARLAFAAHAEAESNVLHAALVRVPAEHIGSRMLTDMMRAHAHQEALFWRLARNVPNTVEWTEVLGELRTSCFDHHREERLGLLQLVREVVAPDVYCLLATSYATERLRALAMMSAVVAKARARGGLARI